MKRGKGGQSRQAETDRRAQPVDAAGLRRFFEAIAARHPRRADIAMLCIGSDRSTGDAFGPLIGARLAGGGWAAVIGTLAAPCDADRLEDALRELPAGKPVVAFDACLGVREPEGGFLATFGPLRPAESVGRRLPPAGDYSVAGVVARMGVKPYANLQQASLRMVMEMASAVADAVESAWPSGAQNRPHSGKMEAIAAAAQPNKEEDRDAIVTDDAGRPADTAANG